MLGMSAAWDPVAGVAGAGSPGLGQREVGGRAREKVRGRAGRKDVEGRAEKDVLEREGPNDVGDKIAAEDKEEVLKVKILSLVRFAPSSLAKNGGVKK